MEPRAWSRHSDKKMQRNHDLVWSGAQEERCLSQPRWIRCGTDWSRTQEDVHVWWSDVPSAYAFPHVLDCCVLRWLSSHYLYVQHVHTTLLHQEPMESVGYLPMDATRLVTWCTGHVLSCTKRSRGNPLVVMSSVPSGVGAVPTRTAFPEQFKKKSETVSGRCRYRDVTTLLVLGSASVRLKTEGSW